jgi:hypothetical protein
MAIIETKQEKPPKLMMDTSPIRRNLEPLISNLPFSESQSFKELLKPRCESFLSRNSSAEDYEEFFDLLSKLLEFNP